MSLTQAQPDPRNPEHLLTLLTPTQRELIEARRSHCEPCSQNKKLSIVSVQCDACGCAGVSLIHGRCKLRKWPPAPGRDADGHAIAMPPLPVPTTPAWLPSSAMERDQMRLDTTPATSASPRPDYSKKHVIK